MDLKDSSGTAFLLKREGGAETPDGHIYGLMTTYHLMEKYIHSPDPDRATLQFNKRTPQPLRNVQKPSTRPVYNAALDYCYFELSDSFRHELQAKGIIFLEGAPSLQTTHSCSSSDSRSTSSSSEPEERIILAHYPGLAGLHLSTGQMLLTARAGATSTPSAWTTCEQMHIHSGSTEEGSSGAPLINSKSQVFPSFCSFFMLFCSLCAHFRIFLPVICRPSSPFLCLCFPSE